MFKLFKRMNKTELLMAFFSVAFVCAGVWLDLEVPSYMSEITTLLQEKGTEVSLFH